MLIAAASYGNAMGVETDSVAGDTVVTDDAKQLKEVVVEAQLQHTAADKTTYIPDKNSKAVAQNAIDLLAHMAIPQIEVNPVTNAVTTPKGDDIAIFIDMAPASAAEKDALRAGDVKRVEYYVYPTDPRFNHQRYVVNIVLRHYEYGGYAKLSAHESFIAGTGGGSAYTKIAYRRMTYDISVSDKYTDRHHNGSDSYSTYRLRNADGTLSDITRSKILGYSRFQTNVFSTSLRARYQTERLTASNTISFGATNTPRDISNGTVSYTGINYADAPYGNSGKEKVIYPVWEGNYYFGFGGGYALAVMPSVQYQYTRSNSLYTTAANSTSIATNATDNAALATVQAQLNKEINDNNTVGVNGYYLYNYDDVKYAGNTNARSKFYQSAYAVTLGYTAQYGKVYGRLEAGVIGERNKIDNVKTSTFSPMMLLSAQYAPTRKSNFELSANYGMNGVEQSDKTPEVLQENEFMYKTGNPNLKSVNWYGIDATYTWLANNRFSMSAFADYAHHLKSWVAEYTPDGPDGTILRTMANDGKYEHGKVGATATLRLLNRSLVLKASPTLNIYNHTGMYDMSMNSFSYSVQATYYLGKCYASIYFRSADKKMMQYVLNQSWYKNRTTYQLRFGWSNSHWNVNLALNNIFRKDWRTGTSHLQSTYYDTRTDEYSNNYHQFVKLTASYTFGFGKKVKRGDEVSTREAGGSAIIK